MEYAVKRGDFDSLLFLLHANHTEGYPATNEMNAAVTHNLKILEWLCVNYPNNVDLQMIRATRSGADYAYLTMIVDQWLAQTPAAI